MPPKNKRTHTIGLEMVNSYQESILQAWFKLFLIYVGTILAWVR